MFYTFSVDLYMSFPLLGMAVELLLIVLMFCIHCA